MNRERRKEAREKGKNGERIKRKNKEGKEWVERKRKEGRHKELSLYEHLLPC